MELQLLLQLALSNKPLALAISYGYQETGYINREKVKTLVQAVNFVRAYSKPVQIIINYDRCIFKESIMDDCKTFLMALQLPGEQLSIAWKQIHDQQGIATITCGVATDEKPST